MADLFQQGSQWLEQMRTSHCSSPVEYRRPPDAKSVHATYGRTRFEVADESGLTINGQAWDFLILADEFSKLGHAPVIARSFSYVAGYGLRLLPVLQSPAQLRAGVRRK